MEKICFVINSIHIGGPSYVIRNIIRNLDREAFEIFLITLFDENRPEVIEELTTEGVHIINCGFSGRLDVILKKQNAFNSIISKNKITVLHSHGFIPDILSARCRSDVTIKISTIHNNLYADYPEVYGRIKSKLYIPVHIYYLNKLNVCACCSQYVYNSMKTVLTNTVVVRNGIDNTVRKQPVTRNMIGVPTDALLFIYVGQLRKRKNIVWLIRQFKTYHKPNEYLIILGRGAEKEECEKIQDHNIIHYGFSDNPYAFMQISDIYISAALAEGFSIAVLEAMDNGLALFLSDIPAHMEAFDAAKNTFVGESFKSNDSVDFGNKLDVLRAEISMIDKNAIRRIKDQEMSAKIMTRQYEELYAKR